MYYDKSTDVLTTTLVTMLGFRVFNADNFDLHMYIHCIKEVVAVSTVCSCRFF